MRRRVPHVRGRQAVLNSIHSTRVGANRNFVGGFVMAGPRARRIEALRPFVLPTYKTDGPTAAARMIETLSKLL